MVTSSPSGIDCGTDCAETYVDDTVVTLTAAPAVGSTFGGWLGACRGTRTCRVTMSAARSVTATFTLRTYTLTVNRSGSGTVRFTSAGGTSTCVSISCTKSFPYGTAVTLTPVPYTGKQFLGWSGACAGTGDCVLTIDAAKSATARFTP
jgi:hypothetical protein